MSKREKKTLPDLWLMKSIFQVRYPAKMQIFDLLTLVQEKLQDKYEHWRTDRLSLTLHDFKKLCNLVINHQSITYEQDSGNQGIEQDIENENIEIILSQLVGMLKIDSFERLGFRKKYIMPVRMDFTELVTVLNFRLFSQEAELLKFLPKSFTDLLCAIDAEEGDLKFHIKVGPVKKKEIIQYMEFNQGLHLEQKNRNENFLKISSAYPDVAILLDIDIYDDRKNNPVE